MGKKKSLLAERVCQALRPPAATSPFDWSVDHITLDTGEKFDADLEFLRQIMDDYADESVRVINAVCSAQSCKTITLMSLQGWSLVEDPGPTLWVTKSVPEAKKLVKGRLWPMYDHSPIIAERMPKDRNKRNLLEIYFPGYYLVVAGAENEASLQSTPFRRLNLDEVRQWKEGRLEMVRKRTRRYPHNYKHFLITCPDMEGDSVHMALKQGNHCHWEVLCRNPECREWFSLVWGEKKVPGGVKWDTNDITCPDGRWNFDEVCKTLRIECPHCSARYTNLMPSQADRKYFCRVWSPLEPGEITLEGDEIFVGVTATEERPKHFGAIDARWQPLPAGAVVAEGQEVRRRTGRWKATNLNAPSDTRSYTWNALLPHFTSIHDQVKEFLSASEALKWGNFAPLKDHWNETRGLVWSDRLRHQKEENYLTARLGDYATGIKEGRRFLTVDVQAKGGRHYWGRVREWLPQGVSRGIAWRKLMTKEEISEMAKEFDVAETDIGIDAAGNAAAEVYKMIVDSGHKWKALRGEDKEYFLVEKVKRIWDMTPIDPAIGTGLAGRVPLIRLFRFSKPATLDRLFLMMYGELGDWRICAEDLVDDSAVGYKMQVTAWDRRYRTGRNGEEIAEWYQKREHDHATDCERMQIAIAEINGLLHLPTAGELL